MLTFINCSLLLQQQHTHFHPLQQQQKWSLFTITAAAGGYLIKSTLIVNLLTWLPKCLCKSKKLILRAKTYEVPCSHSIRRVSSSFLRGANSDRIYCYGDNMREDAFHRLKDVSVCWKVWCSPGLTSRY